MVNLSPTEESFHESLCSLRLAKQVNQCELGKPKKQLKGIQALTSDGDSSTCDSHSQSPSRRPSANTTAAVTASTTQRSVSSKSKSTKTTKF